LTTFQKVELATTIPLTIAGATATSAKVGTEAIELETRDGALVVTSPVLSICFFSMH